MSRIPKNAIPHAGPTAEIDDEPADTGSGTAARAFSQLTDKVRENPRTAIAAGAAVAAGVVAAAAIGARSRKSVTTGSKRKKDD